MFLKALEIQGFKSFPDRTRITVGKGITAVVGPNGSGKKMCIRDRCTPSTRLRASWARRWRAAWSALHWRPSAM